MNRDEKKLVHNSVVYFKPIDIDAPTPGDSLGRAEFIFCPEWHRTRLKKLTICPVQQRDMTYFYTIDCNAKDLTISSWTHKGISEPHLWRHVWCVEHRCMAIQAYVPPESNYFSVQILTSLMIYFGRVGDD